MMEPRTRRAAGQPRGWVCLAAAVAILLGTSFTARASDPLWEELDRLLAARKARRGAADRLRGEGATAAQEGSRHAEALRTARERLATRFAEQQAAFERTSRRNLPPKARERLARARAAHAEGQGRLLELLRQAAANPDDDARHEQLRELIAPLVEASRSEPLSAELSVRAPALVPPALPVAPAGMIATAAPEAFAASPAAMGPVPPAIRALAESLEGPVEAYAWVRNNVRAELYYGSLKGPVQTLLDRGGNDADTAALLVALLRAKGIPARFTHGTANVDIARLQSITGTANAAQALRVLARAGIPHEPVVGPSGVASVKIARVACEAYVAYANYRGLPQDAQGKVWLPLDPGFKDLRPPSGLDVVTELGIDATALVDEYLAAPRAATPREFVRQRVTEALAGSGRTYEQALNDRSLQPEALGILPNALPYVWTGATQASYDPPFPHDVRIVGEWNGTPLLDATLSLPDVLGKRVTVSYVPADPDDATVVATYGSLAATPPYLIEVRPVLKVGGVVVASGEGAIGMAVKYDLRVTLRGPGGQQVIANRVLAGNLTAIGLGGSAAGVSETDGSTAAALLSHAASEYLRSWNHSDGELADLWRVVPVRPTASACFVASAVEVEYAGGDPLYPISFDWKGVTVDADLRSSAPVGVETSAAESRFVLVSGLEGSILENRLFEDLWQVGSVSTAKVLQLAAAAGTEILTLDRDNVESELAGLPLDASVKDQIREAALRGFRVRVPAELVTFLAWTGSGWWVLDEATGESSWMLQGGYAGGVTAAAVGDWPDEALPETLIDQGEEAAPEETPVARIQKFVSTDFQDGIVNKPLERPFRVLALDEDGQRVPNAPVTFQVIGGGGVFVDPATGEPGTGEVVVLSNARGEAEATLVLGRSTSEIPRFACLRDDPESCTADNEIYATQVGLNLVTAAAGAAVLLEPFSAYGAPDDQFDGTLITAYLSLKVSPESGWIDNLSVAGLLAINTLDPYDNPISNFRVRFAYAAPPELGAPPAGWQVARGPTETPGRLLGRRDYERCIELSPTPSYGTCAGEQEVILARSSTFGSVAYPVLGDSPYSWYKYFIGTVIEPEWSWIRLGTWGRICTPTCSSWSARWPITFIDVRPRPILVGPTGNLIEAHAPGASAPLRFSAFALYEGYTVEPYEDEDGNKHYRVSGNNQWTREPLDDTVFTITPRSPGTGATGSAGYIGNGVYESQMTMAGTPQLNTVDFESSSTPWRIPRDIPDYPTEVDPAAVDEVTLEITKRKFPDQPYVEPGVFSLWGVKATIDSVTPSPVPIENGRVRQQALVAHRVEPPAYLSELSATQLWFLLERDQELVLAGSGTDGQPFRIPAGLAFPPGDYVGKLTIPGVSGGGMGITSEPFPISSCEPLELLTPSVVLPYDSGPTAPACETQDRIRFKLCAPSRVTIRVGAPGQSEILTARIDGQLLTIDGLELDRGEHVIEVPREIFEGREEEPLPFEVLSVPIDAPGLPNLARGVAAISSDLVTLVTPVVQIKLTVDYDNGVVLGKAKPMQFAVCKDVRATVKVDGSVLSAGIDGGPQIPLDGIVLEAGLHEVTVPLLLLGLNSENSEPFEVSAETLSTPVVRGAKTGVIMSSVSNRSIMPVGHTFVKGVDVSDGHLAVSETDLAIPGRHLGLEMSRTYSSSGQDGSSPMGAGWNWNYGLNLHIPDVEDTLVVVTGRDGTQMFRRSITPPGSAYTPQRGYHGRLVYNAGDVTFDYFDKANVQHRFEVASADRSEYRLAWIREPHGDRLVLTYDTRGNVTKVVQEQDGTAVHELRLTHERIRGVDRIKTAQIVRPDGSPLGLLATYDYDQEWGNLDRVTRRGTNLATSGAPAPDRVHRYWYTVTTPRDRHQLVEMRYPNLGVEQRTRFQYYGTNDPMPGQSPTNPYFVPNKEELVKVVYEFPGGAELQTRFEYDWTEGLKRRFKTVVTDADQRNTLYVQDGRGSTIEVHEPLGKSTYFTWNDDVRKETERDAKNRVTRYGWDGNGNQTSEIVEAGGTLGDVPVLGASYHGTFNKMTSRTDAEGNTTTWSIRDTNGDVLSMKDAEGNVTTYEYDGGAANGPGLLTATTDARGNRTTYSNHHPTFGQPRRIEDPLGNVTVRQYDDRGRLTLETDSFDRRTERRYDGFDRETQVVRDAEAGSDDEITTREYYPLGQVRFERTANGAATTFTLDGLGRVVETATSLASGVLRTATSYDRVGNKEFETDRRNVRRRFVYDDLNRLTDVHIESGPAPRPTGLIAKFDYDLVGNKLWERDVAGLQTDFAYDGLYRVTEKRLPEQMPSGYTPAGRLIERYGYDKVGNRTSVTDPNGHETRFEYDRLNRLTKTMRDPGGLDLVATIRYCNAPAADPPGGTGLNRCEEHDESKGLRTLYAYDELNRETTRTVRLEGPDGDGDVDVYVTETRYEDSNHVVRVEDPNGKVTRTRLDGLDRPVEVVVDENDVALRTQIFYDGLSNRKRVVDPRDNPVISRYDGLSRLMVQTDALSRSANYEYDGEGLRVLTEDRRDVRTRTEYDNLGRETRSFLENTPYSNQSWSRRIEYRDSDRLRIETDARGKATTFLLDGLGRVIRETDDDDHFALTKWDGVNKVEQTDKRPAHHVTRFGYDAINRPTLVKDPPPFGYERRTRYLDTQNQVEETDRRGTVKLTQLDSLGRVRSITDAVGRSEQAVLERNTYDGVGNKLLGIDAEERKTAFAYDGANRLKARTDGYGSPMDAATTSYAYDRSGNREIEQDQRARDAGQAFSIKREFDRLNRVEDEFDGEGNHSVFGYDQEGNRNLVQEPKGQRTTFSYDERGALLTVTQPSTAAGAPVTLHGYDQNRNRTSQKDARQNEVRMEYDDLNRLEWVIQPGDLKTHHEYDANGNLERVTDPNGNVTVNTYDELNRLRVKTYTLATGVEVPWGRCIRIEYEYDENGNVMATHEDFASGTSPPVRYTTSRVYDRLDRLTSETSRTAYGQTVAVGYSYFRNGLRKTVTDAAGAVTAYEYDDQNRLKHARSNAGTPEERTTSYTYLKDGLVSQVNSPNGVTANHLYDRADRLRHLTNTRGGTVISSYAYSYDRNGNREQQVEVNDGRTETTTYGYDALNRLERVTYPIDPSNPSGRTVSYTYDLVGNRTGEKEVDGGSVVRSDKTAVFDALNRLTSVDDTVNDANDATFTYDRNGNQLTKATGGITNTYVYDTRNQLAEVRSSTVPAPVARFQYDAEGRRILKIGAPLVGGDSGTRQYVYDENSVLQELDPTGVLLARYEWGGDRLLSLNRIEGSTLQRRFYSFDALGSVTNLTDDTGVARASYHLDAWGNFRFPAQLSPPSDPLSGRNRFAFTGYLWDQESELYYAKARLYDPEFGRFTSQDSFLGEIDAPPSLHRYFYANDNPTRFIDPDGHAVIQSQELYDNELLGRAREYNPNTGKVDHLAICRPDLDCIKTEDPSIPLRAVLALAGGDKAKAYQIILEMQKAGQRSAAGIMIEESDFASGRGLDKAKLFNLFISRVGTHAASIDGLREEFYAAIEGAKVGEVRDISFLFNVGHDYSTAVNAEQAQQYAKNTFGPDFIQREAFVAGSWGAAPPDVVVGAAVSLAGDTLAAVSAGLGIYRLGAGLAATAPEVAGARAPRINLIGERARRAERAMQDAHSVLRSRAQAIHRGFDARAQGERTTAVALFEDPRTGARFHGYAVSNNRTAEAVRAEAAAGGEVRITGPGGDAEQILLNYAEQKGLRVRAIAPSRVTCGPARLNCGGRVLDSGARLLNPDGMH